MVVDIVIMWERVSSWTETEGVGIVPTRFIFTIAGNHGNLD